MKPSQTNINRMIKELLVGIIQGVQYNTGIFQFENNAPLQVHYYKLKK
jgi:hypothetical protein